MVSVKVIEVETESGSKDFSGQLQEKANERGIEEAYYVDCLKEMVESRLMTGDSKIVQYRINAKISFVWDSDK